MKTKIKSATLGYTLEPLSRTFAPVHHKSLFHFWYHVFKHFATKANIRLSFMTNENKRRQREEWGQRYCAWFNEQRRSKAIFNQWANPNPHVENTQQIINDLKFGKL